MNNANRAAHVITGSHSWGPHDSCAKFDKRMEFHVNAAKGDAVLFLGSLYHVASALLNAGIWSAGKNGKFFLRYPFMASARSGAGLYLALPVTIA